MALPPPPPSPSTIRLLVRSHTPGRRTPMTCRASSKPSTTRKRLISSHTWTRSDKASISLNTSWRMPRAMLRDNSKISPAPTGTTFTTMFLSARIHLQELTKQLLLRMRLNMTISITTAVVHTSWTTCLGPSPSATARTPS